MPQPGKHFVGREDELALLDAAWVDAETNIVEFVAFGGVGKSALTAHWLERMRSDGWRGAARVFGHSFYSQGSRDDAQASADSFLNEALIFFGDDDPTAGSPWDKGERLARLISEQPTLLILDGVEPLQNPPTSGDAGQIRDPGLAALIRELAVSRLSLREKTAPFAERKATMRLVVISTRARVQDIEWLEETTEKSGLVKTVKLESLKPAAGAALLRQLGVKGTQEQSEQASEEVRGHGLALSLLGNYLREACLGDIEGRHDIGLLNEALDVEQGGHAKRMMQRLEQWLAGQTKVANQNAAIKKSGHVSLEILRLTGLFDRPITMGEFAAIIKGDAGGGGPIPGLTDATGAASIPTLNQAIGNLESVNLVVRLTDDTITLDIRPYPATDGRRAFLDAHPLVREHFAAQLAVTPPLAQSLLPAAREAHRRLFEHLKQAAPELPDNLTEMMPLYHAVAHGCKAGLHKSAYDEIFRPRIRREDEFFQIRKLGLFGLDLTALAAFFVRQWDEAGVGLSTEDARWILNAAGFNLSALGRLTEAGSLQAAAIQAAIDRNEWDQAGIAAANRGRLLLTLGDVSSAVRQCEQSVELADRSGNAFKQTVTRATLADALGKTERRENRAKDDGKYAVDDRSGVHSLHLSFAEATFRAAEAMQRESLPESPQLYSQWGYKYCELLLEQLAVCDPQFAHESRQQALARIHQVRNRAETALKIAERDNLVRDMGLDHLTLGRTWLAEADLLKPKFEQARFHLDQSISLLRRYGDKTYLPLGLLRRCSLWRLLLSFNGKPPVTAPRQDASSDAFGVALNEGDIYAHAECDLAEAESIAKRGSMLIWQIEAALERTRVALCRAKFQIANDKSQIELAQQKLNDARQLIRQTEKPYEPHVPDWDEWEPPEYVGVFEAGEIVGYHCRNDEIERLQAEIQSLSPSLSIS